MSWREKYQATVAKASRRIRMAFPPVPVMRNEKLRDDIADTLLVNNPDQSREWALDMATDVLVVLLDHAPLRIGRRA